MARFTECMYMPLFFLRDDFLVTMSNRVKNSN